MGRARATAEPTEKTTGLKASVLDWTRELTFWPRRADDVAPGEGGMALWDISGESVRANPSLTVTNQFDAGAAAASCKEVNQDLVDGSDAFIARHGYVREGGRYRIVKANRDVVAVFCHGGFGLTWLAHLLSIPLAVVWSSFYLAPSSVTTVLFDERSKEYAAPRAIGVGDMGHLYAEGLRLPNSKYEKKNCYGEWERPSGVKANYF